MSEQTSPQQAPSRRLTRSGDDRMVAGVCGGLADFTGIDPVVFRVVFAVAAIMGGAGIAAYVLAWLIIPGPAGDTSSGAGDLFAERGGRPPWWLAIPLILVFLVFAGALDGWDGHWGGGGFGLVVLVAVGVWLWTRAEQGTAVPPVPPVPPTPPPGTPSRPLVAGEDPTLATPVAPPPPPVPPRPPRERSTLGILTISVMLLVVGGLQVIELGTDHDFHAATVLATALVVVGAGLLVGTFYGRSRGLIGLGIPLVVLTALASVADVPLRGGAGERRWAPATAVLAEDEYRLGMGEARLDLRGIDLDGETVEIEASVGMGRLEVEVPEGVDLEIRAHAGFGEVDLLGDTDDGVDVTRRFADDEQPDDGTLVLDLRVGMGEVEVRR